MSTPTTFIADRYRLDKMLGAGGMGVVWQAWDERLRRPVALKMLRTQPERSDSEREIATNRAMREARITAGLHHPHAVTVFDVVEHEGQPCIVMQLIESTPLSDLLRERGTFAPRDAARVGAQVASALAAAHAMNIVHRDVKPGNILISEDGSAMISDFGISHALGDTTITATGMIHGTPAYLAPEVARGQPSSFASDVFSLGSTLYTMLEGAPPFGADDNAIALLHKVSRGSHPAPRHAGALAPLLREMLSPKPERRPDMASVVSRLTAVYEGTDAAASGSPTVPVVGAAAGAVAAGAVAAAAGDDADVTAADADADADVDDAAAVATETDVLSTGMAPTRPIGATAATERLHESPAEQAQPDGLAAFDAVVRPTRNRPSPPPVARPVGSRPGAPPPTAPAAPPSEPRPPRRRRTGPLVGILVLVGVLLLGGGAWLFGALAPDAGTAGGPGAGEAPAASRTPDDATSPPETSAADAQPAPVEPSPSPPAEAPPPASPEQRIVDTLTTYYSMVPGDLDGAWPLMTADYQVNHVGGRGAYADFWGEVADVEVTDVRATPPDAAQATLTYSFTDGSVVQEVTAYRLVDEGGVLKIAATEVLSSVEP